MKFTVSNSPQTDVTFRAEVDGDGDLILYANGNRLVFISSGTGELCRISTTINTRKLLPEFKFDKDGRIKISI